jgi:hypothetical protein
MLLICRAFLRCGRRDLNPQGLSPTGSQGPAQARSPRSYEPLDAVRARSCSFCAPVVTQSVTHVTHGIADPQRSRPPDRAGCPLAPLRAVAAHVACDIGESTIRGAYSGAPRTPPTNEQPLRSLRWRVVETALAVDRCPTHRIPLRAGPQPEPPCAGLNPARPAPASVAKPIHERMVDRQDPLLPARHGRSDAPCLCDERMPRSISIGGSARSRSSRTQRSVTRVRRMGWLAIGPPP